MEVQAIGVVSCDYDGMAEGLGAQNERKGFAVGGAGNLTSALDRKNVKIWLLSRAMIRTSSGGDSAILRTLKELLSFRNDRVRLYRSRSSVFSKRVMTPSSDPTIKPLAYTQRLSTLVTSV